MWKYYNTKSELYCHIGNKNVTTCSVNLVVIFFYLIRNQNVTLKLKKHGKILKVAEFPKLALKHGVLLNLPI